MQNLSLEKIIDFSGAELLQGDTNLVIKEIVIDSREVNINSLFIAIIGENQDGHQYLEDAVENGAAALIVDREIENDFINDTNISILKVDNTTKALQDIAHNYRMSFDNLEVIAVTDSAGKTTTKDLIFSVLSQKYKVLKTQGNYNNHIGLPLTILSLNGNEDIAVLEMGMSGFGEIKRLAEIASPDLGIITNVGPAHLKQLGSLENIAAAKKELLDELDASSHAVLNYDNKYTRDMAQNFPGQVTYFGLKEGADIRAVNINYKADQELQEFEMIFKGDKYEFYIEKAGKHNIYNALAAAAAAFRYGLSSGEIQKGLLNIDYSSLRMEVIKIKNNISIINDTYNANPISVKAAVDVLKDFRGERKILVLASMLELGKESLSAHREIGRYTAEKGIDILIAVGKKAFSTAAAAEEAGMRKKCVRRAENKKEAVKILKNMLQKEDTLLIKGSRANKMEKITKELNDKGAL